jgi:diguanylate cyclase (GGDEF)-like protein/PAS domain S-box-containing protein
VSIQKTKIRQLVSRQVITVDPTTPTREAVAIMAWSRISCLVVASGKKPLGIFTERDVVRLSRRDPEFGSRSIAELMSSPVVTIPGTLSVVEAYTLMLTNRIRHHVVVDHSGRIMGVISQSDLIGHLGLEFFVEMRRVEQVMTTNVATVDQEAAVREAIDRMAVPGISCILVAEEGLPVGILTERDAVRLVADEADLLSMTVGRAMSSPVRTVAVGTSLHKAATFMRQERIRRVVVTDEAGRIAGLITQTDIIRGLQGKYIESLKEIIREKEDILRETARELLDKSVYLDNILSSSLDMAIVATDGEFRIKYFNPVAEQVFCRSGANAIGRSITELHALGEVAPARLQKVREIVRRRGKHLFSARIEHDGIGRFYDGQISGITDRLDRLVGYVLMLHDVTERRQYEQSVHHLAYHDALTGLPNRALLNDRLAQALVATGRNGTSGSLMILDLDRFKDINDTLGHSTGDLLLKAVSGRLTNLLRKSDTVSRMGGDEFVLLLPSVATTVGAATIAGKIVRAFRKPFVCDGHTLKVTASIGIAVFPEDGSDAENLLKNADIALYRVKEGGRNGFARFTPIPQAPGPLAR